MKSLYQIIFILTLGTVFMATQSCNRCKDVTCLNGGECDKGFCKCPKGFTGISCGIEDKCITRNVVCNPAGTSGGACVDGICSCLNGYEGSDCGTETRAKFTGIYIGNSQVSCTISGTQNHPNYYLWITPDSSVVTGIIINLNQQFVLHATMSSPHTFVIPSQTVNSDVFSGDGTLAGATLDLTFSKNDTSVPEDCLNIVSVQKQ